MDSDTLAAEIHAIKVDLIALRSDLSELLSANREVTDFISTMQTVVSEMSNNPMLKAFLPSGLGSQPDMPKLPGM